MDIFSRMWRIVQAGSAGNSGTSMNLRQAEELIEESRRRDEPKIEIPEEPRDPEPATGAMTYERAIAILGAGEGATLEEITIIYRKVIVEYHPDRTSHLDAAGRTRAEARTRELNGAYTFLKEYFSR